MGISHSKRSDYTECIEQLERDINVLNNITNKDSLSMIDEIRLSLMSERIKANLELAKSLTSSLRRINGEELHVYYYICRLVNCAVSTINRFNNKHC